MLLDIAMPGKTGLFLLPEVAKRYPDMAVIMVSGHDELETAVFAMRQGADDYLGKPVAMTLLVHRIEKVMSRRSLLQENKAYRENLENMVSELNQQLEQSKRIVAALNTLVQSPARRTKAD